MFDQFGAKMKRSQSGNYNKKKIAQRISDNGRDSDNNSRNSKNQSTRSRKA